MTAPDYDINVASVIYSMPEIPLDDPTETFWEASKLNPEIPLESLPGVSLLTESARVQVSTTESRKYFDHLPKVALPAGRRPQATLVDVLEQRRSSRDFATEPISFSDLATILVSGGGVTGTRPLRTSNYRQAFRAAPSGGGMYPLDVYLVARAVDGLAAATYYFDPLEECLRRLPHGRGAQAEIAGVSADESGQAACAIVIAASFWRTRFKYGPRGLRFALMEAGHLAENYQLLMSALGLVGFPFGGFYDDAINDQLGLDGVNEAVLYVLLAGSPQRPAST